MKEKNLAFDILKSSSILYIEDEEKIRKDMEETLKLFCKEVFPFSNAEEALKLYNKGKTDIILSDISLENMNGIEFTKKNKGKR